MQTVFNTAGNGLWSNVAKQVQITDMRLTYVDDYNEFGELKVFFNTATWDVNNDGLIYTDKQFLDELKAFLVQHGLTTDVEYSEQGMQGDNYVSFDVYGDFILAWGQKFGFKGMPA